ncbi:hypothetical protein GCM10023084_74180 [Streptomyces lacrimifluminis]|uniref:eCIS core domain-containing protein n=1 Tax=Streptomyces lacrimifluminis TaxID=1500077 RepID=A0A917P716_9ACTN|nr:DUF4157 domain-containing protein [Streptomyces lacrimifluminis]GGJ64402.1 hypothetical protein GCM10012282_71900 [Streptomyces lacrimifluminis]
MRTSGAHAEQHENRQATRGPARAPQKASGSPAVPPPLSADGLRVAQRAVGNAAVTAMIARRVRPAPAMERPDHGVDQVLGSAGKPLATPVRQDMESRFGTDFSDVRLHTGAAATRSARAIGARAYTSGSHVVLGAGGGDKHTLAHELTHVVQQRNGPVSGTDHGNGLRVSDPRDSFEREAESTARRVLTGPTPVARAVDEHAGAHGCTAADGAAEIQRKVGFEFETNMLVRADEKPVISKDEKIFEAASGDWYITPDASAMEFVTVPFEEEGDAPELVRMATAVREMAEAFGLLHTSAKMASLMDGNAELHEVLSGQGTTHQHNGNNVYVPGADRLYPPLAKPQATGGVSLEKVLALFKAVVSQELPLTSPSNPEDVHILDEEPEERTNTTALGGANPKRDAAILTDAQVLTDKYVTDLPTAETRELKGLLALVFSYLLAGAQQSGRQDQAKYFLPLMSRMSFSAMYAALPAEAQSAFDPARVLEVAALAPGDPVYKVGFADHGAGDSTKSQGPQRKQWLDSIASGGPDLMSAGGGSTVTEGMKASSPAMGQHHRLDPGHAPGAADLLQVELRRLPGQVPPEEWLPVATALFEMFRQVQGTKP